MPLLWKLLLVAAIAVLQYLEAPHAQAQAEYATPVRNVIAGRPLVTIIEVRHQRVEADVAFVPVRTLWTWTPVRNFVGACADGRCQQVSQGQAWTPVRNAITRFRNR